MKKNLKPSPIQLLVTIVNPKEVDNVLEILNTMQEKNNLILLGYGTADSQVLDLFGFGIMERSMTLSLVQTKNASALVEKIATTLQFETEERKGLAFTVAINSIEKGFLEELLKGWGKNE